MVAVKKYMKIITSKKIAILIIFVVLAFLYSFHGQWLPLCGKFLVVRDNLEKSDVIIVLGTDPKGEREAWAAKLYGDGLAKRVIMCGYEVGWQASTAEIMKRHAVHLGVPEGAIILDYGWDNNGTWDNALNSLKIVKKNDFKSAIVVTSNYHTRRSKHAFKRVFKDSNVRILISPCPGGAFAPGEWWKSRRLIKSVFLEYTKLFYYFLYPPDSVQYRKS
jgi:uncharacterized SAM-binding protein YcdF (DUF218 family)